MSIKDEMQQYICPECASIGASDKSVPAPSCHICDYKVKMKPCQNGRIGGSILPFKNLKALAEILPDIDEIVFCVRQDEVIAELGLDKSATSFIKDLIEREYNRLKKSN